MTVSSERVVVELAPARVEMEPGGSSVEVIATLQNRSDVVEQYAVEVSGLDPDWYTAPVTSVSLFPQDHDQVRIALHPPRRQGVKAGSYKFRVTVRSRGDSAASASTEGVLDLRGFAVFRTDLTPRRQTARGQGTFRFQVTNTGTADVRIGLEGRDDNNQCRFRFPKGEEHNVAAGSRAEIPVVVQPRARPWVGPDQTYDFSIAARPLDARGEPQSVGGQFTHHPMFRSLRVGGLLKILVVLLVLLLLFVLAFSTGFAEEFGHRTQVAAGQVCGSLYKVPVLGGACPNPNALPEATASCAFSGGFKEFADVEGGLVGACTSDVKYDGFGNGIQYTTKGVLFWLKASNTSYLFENDSVYAFVQGKARLIDGSGRT
jgi:hypothetical protein